MIDSVSSSTAGAALGIRQGQNQVDFGVKALAQNAEQQSAVTSLLSGASASAGGNVTATRGQNLNIVV